MINGTVKIWNSSKGWGFIKGDDGGDYYQHISEVRTGQSLSNNSRVKFDSSQRQRGPMT